MDSEFLSRFLFAFTVGFHYLFPPMSIGLGLLLVFMEGMYIKTNQELYHRMTRFWVKVFGLIFAMGVVTGIVMEFQFGTNWDRYSRFVGDVFGSALAAEGIFAFFLESGFLAILLFGWDKVGKRMHFFSTCMVALGAHFSAIWIIVANSWQQTPAGYRLTYLKDGQVYQSMVEGARPYRAELSNFFDLIFNPSTIDRLTHTIGGAWMSGALLVLSVSAFYLLKKRHQEFARASIGIAMPFALCVSFLQLFTGHLSADGVARHQPAKLAAMEGHFAENAPADLYAFGWVDEEGQTVSGLKLPGMLSFLIHHDTKAPIKGLHSKEPIPVVDATGEVISSYTIQENHPPLNATFQTYHFMVGIGMVLILLSLMGSIQWWRGKLLQGRWLLWIFVLAVILPHLANQLGWATAEIGRQPWIVYGLLKTGEAFSPNVGAGLVLSSIILFGLVYLLLFALFLFLLNNKIQMGPEHEHHEPVPEGSRPTAGMAGS